jgi:hypothetical protein
MRIRRPAEVPVGDAVREALLHPSTDGLDFVRRGMNRQRDDRSPTVPSLGASPAPSPSPSPLPSPAFHGECSRSDGSRDAPSPSLVAQPPSLTLNNAPASPWSDAPSSLAAEPLTELVAEALAAPAASAPADEVSAPRLGPARAAPVRRRAVIDSLVERLHVRKE